MGELYVLQKIMKSPITRSSFVIPLLCVALGICYAFIVPPDPNDWLGLGWVARIGVALLIAAIVSVILSVCAFSRKEKGASKSLIISLPSVIFIAWAGVGYLQATNEREKRREDDQRWRHHSERLSSEKGLFNAERWPNDSSPQGRAMRGALWNGTGDFDEEDLQTLYDKDPTWLDAICYHPKCPEHLLRRRFLHYTESSKRPSSIGGSFLTILAHPNSPLEFIEEVSKWEDLSDTDRWTLDRVLQGKLKKPAKGNTSD